MISVVIPVHNTKDYIEECLESIMKQSFKEIEMICVDSSTDGTTDIINKYTAKDSRIKHIIDNNSSYGYKLNLGFRIAKGEYIGIVDSDDYIEDDMYSALIQYAEKYKVDFVKSDYSSFYEENGRKNIFRTDWAATDISIYGKVFNCTECPELLYNNAVSIWTGLYQRDFILKNEIFLHESEGASFQDTGFSILTHVLAKKIYYLKESFYRYRTDNANSSVKSQKKNNLIADESRWIDQEVERRGIRNLEILKALRMKKLVSYEWNIDRLSKKAALEFADYVHEELELQYVRTGILRNIPDYMNKKFNKIFQLREKYEKNYDKLIQRIGMNRIECPQPVISVIIPVYNTEKYLQECLLSVLEQTEKNIEVICVNDGSVDNCLDILEDVSSIDARVKVVDQCHRGQAYSRNAAFLLAKGENIVYLDSDDLFRANAFEELLSFSKKYNPDIVYFDAECLFEEGMEYNKEKDEYYWRRKSYGLRTGKEIFAHSIMEERFTDSACLMMIKREWLIKQNIRFYDGILYEDSIFSIQCMMKAQRVFHINRKYYIYRIREKSTMTSDPFRAENLYGRVIGLQHFLDIYIRERLEDLQREAFVKWIVGIIWNIKVIGQNISDTELDRFYLMPQAKYLKLELALGEIPWERVSKRVEYRKNLERLEREKNIVIYGAGIRGKRLLEYFYLTDDATRVKEFVVTEQKGQPDIIRGVKVKSRDKGHYMDKEDFIIISFRGDEAIDLKDELEQEGYANVLILDDELHKSVCQRIRNELKL